MTDEHEPDGWRARLTSHLGDRMGVWPERVDRKLILDESDWSVTGTLPDAGTLILFVHGFLGEGRIPGLNVSGANQAAAFRVALAEACQQGPPLEVVATMWSSSATWPTARANAEQAGSVLASWLREHAAQYEVVLVGHSLGGRVALEALSALPPSTVDSVALLGAAVSPAAVRTTYRRGIESAVDAGVYNYFSTNDGIVCRLYRLREGTVAIGCTGMAGVEEGIPAGYTDVDVSTQVRRHLDFFKPRAHTAAGNCVGELVENQLSRDNHA